jgi:hypothetical protein
MANLLHYEEGCGRTVVPRNQREPQAQLVRTLTFPTIDDMGGCLFLGKRKSISPKQRGFEQVTFPWHIYRKVGPASDLKVDFPKPLESLGQSTSTDAVVAETVHQTLVQRLDLPSVLIDHEFNILRIGASGDRRALTLDNLQDNDQAGARYSLRLAPQPTLCSSLSGAPQPSQGGLGEGDPQNNTDEDEGCGRRFRKGTGPSAFLRI